MKIVCYGDSNTWGYDPRGYFGGRYDAPWPGILAEMLGCTVINQGENGREIPVRPCVFPEDADLVIVMLGTNDLLQGAAAEEVCRRMECFLKSLNPDQILLVAPPPMSLGQWVPDGRLIEESKALAVSYRGLAARLGTRFCDAGQWEITLACDGVHLSEAGHRALAHGLYLELSQF